MIFEAEYLVRQAPIAIFGNWLRKKPSPTHFEAIATTLHNRKPYHSLRGEALATQAAFLAMRMPRWVKASRLDRQIAWMTRAITRLERCYPNRGANV